MYKVRHENQVKTKVRIGFEDLVLATKAAGSSYWRMCPLPRDLPPIDLDMM